MKRFILLVTWNALKLLNQFLARVLENSAPIAIGTAAAAEVIDVAAIACPESLPPEPLPPAIAVPKPPETAFSEIVPSRPQLPPEFVTKSKNRGQLVETLLDEAHAQGAKTYDQLQLYIKDTTGEACSRRSISNWKKARNLTNAAQ